MPFKKLTLLIAPILILASTSACDFAQSNSGQSTTTEAERQAITEQRKDLAPVEKSDPVMNAAIAQAKSTLPGFVSKLDASNGALSEATFKYPLAGWEHIWVSDVKHDGGFLTGVLANTPAEPGHKMGDPVRVALKDVSDWAYRDDKGVMQGHYTTKVILPQIDPAEAAGIKESFGW